MFDDFVNLNGVNINASPHMKFWKTLTCQQFITVNVPHASGPIKIVECGNSANSAIIQILQHSYSGIQEMPAGGPYFPKEQVDKFAIRVDKGWPN